MTKNPNSEIEKEKKIGSSKKKIGKKHESIEKMEDKK